jgi:glycosyltransferase involved in cell wall biosynthesis
MKYLKKDIFFSIVIVINFLNYVGISSKITSVKKTGAKNAYTKKFIKKPQPFPKKNSFEKTFIAPSTAVAVHSALQSKRTEKPFVIVTAGRNAARYIDKYMRSVVGQNYKNYRIIIVDDASTDDTFFRIKKTAYHLNREIPITLIQNQTRQGAMYNYYHAIWNEVRDEEIVVIVDLDDALADAEVLNFLNIVYSDTAREIWLTYGQFRNIHSGSIGFCCPMPEHIVKNNAFRKWPHGPSHLRTFYAWLFKLIKKEDLMQNGEFFKMTCDLATMFPMIEMANKHFLFIRRVLLDYNDNNPLNDHRIDWELQESIGHYIRSLPPYQPLTHSPL